MDRLGWRVSSPRRSKASVQAHGYWLSSASTRCVCRERLPSGCRRGFTSGECGDRLRFGSSTCDSCVISLRLLDFPLTRRRSAGRGGGGGGGAPGVGGGGGGVAR